jgi:amidase
MARTVKDAASILQAIAGMDSADNYTTAIPNKGILPDYVAACKSSSLTGARIGVPRNVISKLARDPASHEIQEFIRAIPVLKEAGATIVDPANFTGIEQISDFLKDLRKAEITLAAADFLVNFPAYTAKLTKNPQNITDLASLRKFTRTFPMEEYPDRDTRGWDQTLDKQGWNNTDPRFWHAYQKYVQLCGEGGLLGALRRENLDALILPTSFASVWASAIGAPIVTVPLGFLPANTSVRMDPRGDLVSAAPGLP